MAFDLPTQCGYDSDDAEYGDEVGRVGVAVDTLADAEKKGVPRRMFTGTIGSDILKEYAARGTWMRSPGPSLRLIDRTNAYCTVGRLISTLKDVRVEFQQPRCFDMATRVLVAKPGLNGHDRGAKMVARTLRNTGFEVVYTGIRQRIEDIVSIALQEDVPWLGFRSCRERTSRRPRGRWMRCAPPMPATSRWSARAP